MNILSSVLNISSLAIKFFQNFCVHYGCRSSVQKQNNVLAPMKFTNICVYDILNDDYIDRRVCKMLDHYVYFFSSIFVYYVEVAPNSCHCIVFWKIFLRNRIDEYFFHRNFEFFYHFDKFFFYGWISDCSSFVFEIQFFTCILLVLYTGHFASELYYCCHDVNYVLMSVD